MIMETNGFGYTKMTLYALKQRLHTLKIQLHTLTNRLIPRLINGQCMQCMQKLKLFFFATNQYTKILYPLMLPGAPSSARGRYSRPVTVCSLPKSITIR